MSREDLVSRIALDVKNRAHLTLQEDSKILPGQIRQIRDKDLQSESRLALILKVNKLGRNCEVALVNGIGEIATSRDFEAKLPESDYPLTIFADFQGNVDIDQIQTPNLLGSICGSCSMEISTLELSKDWISTVELPIHGCFNWGNLPLVPMSKISQYREEEFFQFSKLINKFDNYEKFKEYREYQYFYSKQNSMSNMIHDLIQSHETLEERRELIVDIKKNPKQLALLRGR